ncbi:hypothetical protein NCLIV_044180 [Neospora caninum Liverpool]|uniref:Formin FRM1 n=1 Tax=Neospora caninum (strain Liverpool) TaxID=572307 RepID=F0VAX7_NEOCL|nr:hypothetical protein NCLIV_044180 [Neospora caninum Liverpool]CBZ51353.1 hypothetical protein NCLIV_044180 [Neospora caninum Liverpool]CEL68671.1 TPA: formin FRM1 [Neospora caninum Liverpool]|eukprot:XP_003881386.1 hypothetical protein NCLIV_044180 [Neospora caninum Liverpool]
MPPPPPPPKGKKAPLPKKISKAPPPPGGKSAPEGGEKATPAPSEAKAATPAPSEAKAATPAPSEAKAGPPAGKLTPPKGKTPPPKAGPPPGGVGLSEASGSTAKTAAPPPGSLVASPAPKGAPLPAGKGKAPPAASAAPALGPEASGDGRHATFYSDASRPVGLPRSGMDVVSLEQGGEALRAAGEAAAAKAAMMVQRFNLADLTNVPVASVHGTEPPAFPFAPGAERNPALLTTAIKAEMAMRSSQPTQTEEERRLMLAGSFSSQQRISFKMTPEHQRVAEALTLLRRIEDFRGSVQAGEVQRIRYLLRVGAIEAFSQQRYSDAMLQALHSYLIAKAYYTAYESTPLEGEMVPELLLLAKCCGLSGCPDRGEEFLRELRYIVENTLIFVSTGSNAPGAAAAKASGPGGANRGSPQGPVMKVEKHVLASVVSSLAELCSLYNQPENAKLFYEKYVILTKDVYGADSLAVSDALNTVALYFFRTRQYDQALPLVEQVLDIRKKHLGDFDVAEPNARVADCYANIGLLHRLLGRPAEAFPFVLISLDMRMRIYQTRDTEAVQDMVLALGCLQHQAGHFQEALEAYKEVWAFRNKTLGVTHPDTVNVEMLLRQLEKDFAAQMQEDKQRFVHRDKALPSASAFDLTTRAASQPPLSRRGQRPGDVFYEETYDLSYDEGAKKTLVDYVDSSEAVRLLKPSTAATLEEYRHQQTAKGCRYNARGVPFHSVARMRALYGEEWRSMMVPSVAILPYVDVEVTGPDTLKLAECFQFQEALSVERPTLPVVNVPQIERGEAMLENGRPHMVVNPDAADLLTQWGVALPEVDENGKVVNRDPKFREDEGFRLFLPLVDPSTNQPFVGFFGEPVMVPNPAVYHTVIAPAILRYARKQAALAQREKSKLAGGQAKTSSLESGMKVAPGVVVAKLKFAKPSPAGKLAKAKPPVEKKAAEAKAETPDLRRTDSKAKAPTEPKTPTEPKMSTEPKTPKDPAPAPSLAKKKSAETPGKGKSPFGSKASSTSSRSGDLKGIPAAPPSAKDGESSSSESESDSDVSEKKSTASASSETAKAPVKKAAAGFPPPKPAAGLAKPKGLLGGGPGKFDASAYKAKVKGVGPLGKKLTFRPVPQHKAVLPATLRYLGETRDSLVCEAPRQREKMREEIGATSTQRSGEAAAEAAQESGRPDGAGERGTDAAKEEYPAPPQTEAKRAEIVPREADGPPASAGASASLRAPPGKQAQSRVTERQEQGDTVAKSQEEKPVHLSAETPDAPCREGETGEDMQAASSFFRRHPPSPPRSSAASVGREPDFPRQPPRSESQADPDAPCGAPALGKEESSPEGERREREKSERERTKDDFKNLLLKKQQEHMSVTLMRLQQERDGRASQSVNSCSISAEMSRSLETEKGDNFPRLSQRESPGAEWASSLGFPGMHRLSAVLTASRFPGDDMWRSETATGTKTEAESEPGRLRGGRTERPNDQGSRQRECLASPRSDQSAGTNPMRRQLDPQQTTETAGTEQLASRRGWASSRLASPDLFLAPGSSPRAPCDSESPLLSLDSSEHTESDLFPPRSSRAVSFRQPGGRRGLVAPSSSAFGSSGVVPDASVVPQSLEPVSSRRRRETEGESDSPAAAPIPESPDFLRMPFLTGMGAASAGLFSPPASSTASSRGSGERGGGEISWSGRSEKAVEGVLAAARAFAALRNSAHAGQRGEVRRRDWETGKTVASVFPEIEARKGRPEIREAVDVFSLSSEDLASKPRVSEEEQVYGDAPGEPWDVDWRYIGAERESERRRRGRQKPGGPDERPGHHGEAGDASCIQRETRQCVTGSTGREPEGQRRGAEQSSSPVRGSSRKVKDKKRPTRRAALRRASRATRDALFPISNDEEMRNRLKERRKRGNPSGGRANEEHLDEAELSVSDFHEERGVGRESEIQADTDQEVWGEEDGEEAELLSAQEGATDPLELPGEGNSADGGAPLVSYPARGTAREDHPFLPRSSSPSPARSTANGSARFPSRSESSPSRRPSAMPTSRFLRPVFVSPSASSRSSAYPSSPARPRQLSKSRNTRRTTRNWGRRERERAKKARGDNPVNGGRREARAERDTGGRLVNRGRDSSEGHEASEVAETEWDVDASDVEEDASGSDGRRAVFSPETFHGASLPFWDGETEKTESCFSSVSGSALFPSNRPQRGSGDRFGSDEDERTILSASSRSSSVSSRSFACGDDSCEGAAERGARVGDSPVLFLPAVSSVGLSLSASPTVTEGELDGESPGCSEPSLGPPLFAPPEAEHARPLPSPGFRKRLFGRRESGVSERDSHGDTPSEGSWSPASAGVRSHVPDESCGSNASSPSSGALRGRVSLGSLRAAFLKSPSKSSNEDHPSPAPRESSSGIRPLASLARRLSGAASRLAHSSHHAGESEEPSARQETPGGANARESGRAGLVATCRGDMETQTDFSVGALGLGTIAQTVVRDEKRNGEGERQLQRASLRRFSFTSLMKKDLRRPGRTVSDSTVTATNGEGKASRLGALFHRRSKDGTGQGDLGEGREPEAGGEEREREEAQIADAGLGRNLGNIDKGPEGGAEATEADDKASENAGGEERHPNEQARLSGFAPLLEIPRRSSDCETPPRERPEAPPETSQVDGSTREGEGNLPGPEENSQPLSEADSASGKEQRAAERGDAGRETEEDGGRRGSPKETLSLGNVSHSSVDCAANHHGEAEGEAEGHGDCGSPPSETPAQACSDDREDDPEREEEEPGQGVETAERKEEEPGQGVETAEREEERAASPLSCVSLASSQLASGASDSSPARRRLCSSRGARHGFWILSRRLRKTDNPSSPSSAHGCVASPSASLQHPISTEGATGPRASGRGEALEVQLSRDEGATEIPRRCVETAPVTRANSATGRFSPSFRSLLSLRLSVREELTRRRKSTSSVAPSETGQSEGVHAVSAGQDAAKDQPHTLEVFPSFCSSAEGCRSASDQLSGLARKEETEERSLSSDSRVSSAAEAVEPREVATRRRVSLFRRNPTKEGRGKEVRGKRGLRRSSYSRGFRGLRGRAAAHRDASSGDGAPDDSADGPGVAQRDRPESEAAEACTAGSDSGKERGGRMRRLSTFLRLTTNSKTENGSKETLARRRVASLPPLPPPAHGPPVSPFGLGAAARKGMSRLRRRSSQSTALEEEKLQERNQPVTLCRHSFSRDPRDSAGHQSSSLHACERGEGGWPRERQDRSPAVKTRNGEERDENPRREAACAGEDEHTETDGREGSSSEESDEETSAQEWVEGSSDEGEDTVLPEEEDESGEDGEREGRGEDKAEVAFAKRQTTGLRSGVTAPHRPCPSAEDAAAPRAERLKTGLVGSESGAPEWDTSDWSVGESSSDEEVERPWQDGPSSSSDEEKQGKVEDEKEEEKEAEEKEGEEKEGEEKEGEESQTQESPTPERFRNAGVCLDEMLRLTATPPYQRESSIEISELYQRQWKSLRTLETAGAFPRQLRQNAGASQQTLAASRRVGRHLGNRLSVAKKAPLGKAVELSRASSHSPRAPCSSSSPVRQSCGSVPRAFRVSSAPSVSPLPIRPEPCGRVRLLFGGAPVSFCVSAGPPRFLTQPVHALPPKGPKGGPPKKGKAAGWAPPPPRPPPGEDEGTQMVEGRSVLKQGIFKKPEAAPKKDLPPKEVKALEKASQAEAGKVETAKKAGPPLEKVAVKSVPKPSPAGPPKIAAKTSATKEEAKTPAAKEEPKTPAAKEEAKAAPVAKEEAKAKAALESRKKGDGFAPVKLPLGKPPPPPKTPKMKIVIGQTGKATVLDAKASSEDLDYDGIEPSFVPPYMGVPPVPRDVLSKITKLKPGTEKDPQLGEVPVVILMDDNNVELARLPWQVDISSFSLAQSSMSILVARRLGLLARRLDEDKKEDDTRNWLTGEGLKKFGLSMQKEKPTFGDTSLLLGMGLAALPAALAQKKPEPPKKEEAKPKEEPKKEAPKKGPPGGKGGKGPPGKGPPKAKGKGPKKKGEGGLKVGKKDEGKTKRFFWDPIFEDEIPGTIFMKKPTLQLKLQDVEETFAKVVAKKKAETKKPKIIQLLPDSKRAYNMNIALSKFNNYSYQQLREAIIDLDPKILTIEATETLLNFVPTGEENQVVKEYINSGGDLKLVDRPEQFVAAMLGVPLMKQRLEAHAFALNFREAYSDAYTPLENMADACDAIDDSQNLKVVLFAILELGNALNEGDPQRGSASGFKPTTLAKLQEIRTTTKPVRTMLQYICDIIWEQQPTALNIYEDLKICDKAQRVDMQGIEGRISNLKAGLTKVKNTLEAAKKGNESTGVMGDRDPLRKIMDEFLIEAEPKIKQLDDFLVQVQSQFLQTCHYSGYPDKDVKKIKPDELFKQVAGFARQVDAIRKQKQEIADRELKRKEAEAKRAGKGIKTTAIRKLRGK